MRRILPYRRIDIDVILYISPRLKEASCEIQIDSTSLKSTRKSTIGERLKVRIQALDEGIVLFLGQDTDFILILPLSAQVYSWVPEYRRNAGGLG